MVTDETCDFHDSWDAEGEPAGERCGKPARRVILWLDGSRRWSLGCTAHGHATAIQSGAPPFSILDLRRPRTLAEARGDR